LVVRGNNDFLAKKNTFLVIAMMDDRRKLFPVTFEIPNRLSYTSPERPQWYRIHRLAEVFLQIAGNRESLAEASWCDE